MVYLLLHHGVRCKLLLVCSGSRQIAVRRHLQCSRSARTYLHGSAVCFSPRAAGSGWRSHASLSPPSHTRAATLPGLHYSSSLSCTSLFVNQSESYDSSVARVFHHICRLLSRSLRCSQQLQSPSVLSLTDTVWFHSSAGRGQQRHGGEQSSSDGSNKGGDGGNPMNHLARMVFFAVLGYIMISSVTRILFGSQQMQQSALSVSWSEFEHQLLSRGEVRELIVHPDAGVVTIVLHPHAVVNGRLMDGQHLQLTIPNVDILETRLREAESRLGISMNDRIPVVYDRLQGTMSRSIISLLAALLFLALLSSARSSISSTLGNMTSFTRAKFTIVNSMTGEGRGVKFSDVAGLHEAKQEIREFVDYLKRPQYYLNLGAKVPKGALLLGPPGCGKTLLAKAVATEGGVPFISMNGSEFIEMIGGLGAARVRDLFREARKRAPCIVYIDEIDAIGRARHSGASSAGGMHGEMEQTLNQLLVETDGMSTIGGVVMLASTNRADLLDKALLRPGRFDRHITIDLPTLIERRQIFEHHLGSILLQNKPTHYSQRLAQLTPGFSGADIMNVCNESALKAARDGHTSVTDGDLEYAVERVVGGTEKRTHVLSANQRRVVAIHESGHALTGWLLEHTDALLSVSIVPRTRGMLGLSRHVPSDQKLYTTEQLFDRMCMALGGRVAESVVFNTVTDGARNDLERVTKMAYAQVREYGMSENLGPLSYDTRMQSGRRPYSRHTASIIDQAARDLVARAYRRTELLLSENREKLKTLADALMTCDSLKYEDVLGLIGPPPYGSKRTVSSDEFEGSMEVRQKSPTEKGDGPAEERASDDNSVDNAASK